jgi:hypothetical protein
LNEVGETNGLTEIAVGVGSFIVSMAALLTYVSAFPDPSGILFAGLCWLMGRFASTLVHEAGHAIAAIVRGWRIIMFAVRPIGFQVPNRDLAFVPRGFGQGFGGWIVTVPRGPDEDAGRNWSIILAAGPAASLLLAVVLLAVAGFLPPEHGHAILVGRIALGFGLQSLHACLFPLLPSGRPDHPSDGDQLWALRRPEGRYELHRPIIWLETLLASKVRLSALPDWLLAQAGTLPSPTDETAKYLATIYVGRALDSAPVDIERARRLIVEYRARYGSGAWLAACDLYLAAIWERNRERAAEALVGLPYSPDLRPLYFAAQAAGAARMGQASLARSALEDMKKALGAESPFKDLTFRDIRRQIEGALI